MKRGITILVSLCALVTVAYFTASKWAIRHETIMFTDASRGNRPVEVDIAVRRDKEMQANAGMIEPAGRDPQSRQHRQKYRVLVSRKRLRGARLSVDQPSARSADRSADGDQGR